MDFAALTALGHEIDRRWSLVHFDKRAFPDLALDALRAARLDQRLDLAAIARRAASRVGVHGWLSDFGDIALMVFSTPHFFIEVLVWHQGSTTIHEHSFAGAFQVFAGSSIHSRYRFEVSRRLDDRVQIGRAELTSTELLSRGDARAIEPGPSGLRHALFHLDAPSCSVVVRTHGESEDAPQRDYLPPAIAISPRWGSDDPWVGRAARAVELALALDDDELVVRTLEAAVSRLDTFRALRLVLYAPLRSPALRARILERLPALFGDLAEPLAAALARDWLMRDCVRLRSRVHDPDQRFVLAAAMNAPTAPALRGLLQQRAPAAEPLRFLADQLLSLARDGRLSVRWSAADDAASHRAILDGFLRGASAAELAAEIGEPASSAAEALDTLARDPLLAAIRPLAIELAAGAEAIGLPPGSIDRGAYRAGPGSIGRTPTAW